MAPVDPEFEALPEPRRPWRRVTLGAMALTGISAITLASSLWSRVLYSVSSAEPSDVGALTSVQLTERIDNRWVHGTGEIEPTVVQYRRPLDSDTYRLSPLVGQPRIWVELRVPGDLEPERYVAPTSFVGRLVRLDHAGLSYTSIADAVEATTGRRLPPDAWLFVDGDAPSTSRWVIGVVAMLFAFTIFSAAGIVHLMHKVRDE